MALTDDERQLVDQARELGPALRASNGDRDRLAGWLLKELADLAERLGQAEIDRQEAIAASWHQRQAEGRSDLESQS